MFNNSLLLLLIFNLSILSMSISDLLLIWFMMELNNFMFISFLLINMKNKKTVFLYFLIQFLSSSFLMMIFTLDITLSSKSMNFLMSLTLMLKLSIPPFHLWLLIMIKHFNWFTLFTILSIQKIIPFYMLSFNMLSPFILWFMIISSLTIPPFNLINSTNLKVMFFYSSISHSAWFIILIMLKIKLWLIYFFSYSMVLMMFFCLIQEWNNLPNLKTNHIKPFSMYTLILFFNLATLPPFILMAFKWYIMSVLINNIHFSMMFFFLMLNALIMMFIYLRLGYNIMFYNKSKPHKIISLKKKNSLMRNILSCIIFIVTSMLIITL